MRVIGYIAFVVASLAFAACGNAHSPDSFGSGDYEIIGKTTSVASTPTPEPAAKEHEPATERQPLILTDVGEYSVGDFESLTNFKLSKSYDVEGLESADSAIYGFDSALTRTIVRNMKRASTRTTALR